MSKIMQELITATGLKTERGQSDQEFRAALLHAVHQLDDKGWDGLSEAAQDWFNNAADAKNAKKEIPGFPDEVKEEASTRRRGAAEPEATSRRRSAEPDPTYEPKVGDVVTVKTKRGAETKGKVVEVNRTIIAIDDGKEELEFQLDRVDTITPEEAPAAGGRRRSADPEPAKAAEPKVGDVVTVKTKRGAVYEGKLVELDDKGGVVVDKDGKDCEFDHDRVESITVKGGEPEPSGRRSRGGDDGGKDKGGDGKNTKISRADNKGVSATMRMRELILDDLDAKEEAIGKALKKEGLVFKDNTLQLVFSDVHRLVKMMTERKMLK